MPEVEKNSPGANEVFRQFPNWFIAIFALVYVSGYLIDFFYYSNLGIMETGAEPLKFHYIQIGLVFILGYMIVVGVLFFAVFGAQGMYRSLWVDRRPLSNMLTSIMIMSFFLSLYVVAIFTPPLYFQTNSKHFYMVLYFVGVGTGCFLLLVVIDAGYLYIVKLIGSGRHSHQKKEAAQQKNSIGLLKPSEAPCWL